MRPKDIGRGGAIEKKLIAFDSNIEPLLGIRDDMARIVLVEQIIESVRRIEYTHFIRDNKIDPRRADPSSDLFDPLRAAVLKIRKGDMDEAFWLIFLATHFGKHAKYGWGLARSVYGALGSTPWTWSRVSSNVSAFREWLSQNEATIRSQYSFSNHRKYQSLSASSKTGTGAVIDSYVAWIAPPRTHSQMIREIHAKVGQNPGSVFDHLYQSMRAVKGFGRLGKFDFLTMLGKLGIAPIEPGSPYLVGATGPLEGARLLFAADKKARITPQVLDQRLVTLGSHLGVGMQVLEDSLCNWQKSPRNFISFRG